VNVSPHARLCRQLTHYTQILNREWVPETRSLEPGIASKMSLATLVEWPSQVCTHRPSHCISSRSSEVVTRCPSWKVRMDREEKLIDCWEVARKTAREQTSKTGFSSKKSKKPRETGRLRAISALLELLQGVRANRSKNALKAIFHRGFSHFLRF